MIGSSRRSQKLRGEQKNLVRFVVSDTTYSFDVHTVEEVVHPHPITPLPHMGPSIVGVFDHRGRVTPVVDLRLRFGMEPAQLRSAKWILTRTQFGLVGFVVDRVLDVVGTAGALSPTPNVGAGQHSRGIRGVTNVDGNLVFSCDENLLASVVSELVIPDKLAP